MFIGVEFVDMPDGVPHCDARHEVERMRHVVQPEQLVERAANRLCARRSTQSKQAQQSQEFGATQLVGLRTTRCRPRARARAHAKSGRVHCARERAQTAAAKAGK